MKSLLLVALSRSYHELNIFETEEERKLRLERQDADTVSQDEAGSSQLSETLGAIAESASVSANEASAERTALNVMGLAESPSSMRDFKEFVATKRALLDDTDVPTFMEASNVIKRRLLAFQPTAPTCSICLAELGRNGEATSLLCAHSYCTGCIAGYVIHCNNTGLTASCPNCKRELTEDELGAMAEDELAAMGEVLDD